MNMCTEVLHATDVGRTVPCADGLLKQGEPMSRHTSWRVGGPADLFFTPATRHGLSRFLARLPELATHIAGGDERSAHEAMSTDDNIPVIWSGLGSNLLVRDGGIRGVVIRLDKALSAIHTVPVEANEEQPSLHVAGRCTDTVSLAINDGAPRRSQDDALFLYAEAGAPCSRIARRSVELGMHGAEFLCGIPGTLGGALAMNAGAFGGEIWELVQCVETIDRYGQFHRRDAHEYTAGYRRLSGPSGEWFIAAQLALHPLAPSAHNNAQAGSALIDACLAKRNRTQPAGLPSAGSVFRNPLGNYAAELIESAGLKGRAYGKARVSEMHANFIINEGGARAADIERLIEDIRSEVRRIHGVHLETEVHIIGELACAG